MDSDALQTFVAIHRAGGFSNAAERLHRSQPAVSRRIALLEEEIGAPLFERVPGGVVLSEVGRQLLPRAERVLAALRDASDALSALRAGKGGSVSLAVVGTLANMDLTAVLRRFAANFPSVELALATATSAEVSELVRRGEAAIGLRYFDDVSPELVCRTLRPESLVVVCGRRHPLAGKTVRSLRDLRGERWVAFPTARREASRDNISALFLAHGISDVQWIAVDSLTAQKRLVEAGYGLSLMPESAIEDERKRKTLASINVGDLAAATPVAAIVRKNGYLSPAAEALLDLIVAEFAPGGVSATPWSSRRSAQRRAAS